MQTPWGRSDSKQEYAPGITFYDTPGHGGFKLHKALNDVVPYDLRNENCWYEEDCEWAIVAFCFPTAFKPDVRKDAENTLINWYPDQYMRLTGETLQPEQSFKLRERAFDAAHKDSYVVLAAWGDWHKDVPEGMVGVYATIGGKREFSHGTGKYFLVPRQEYERRADNDGHFVIDLARHEEIAEIR